MLDREQLAGLQTLLAHGRGRGKTHTLIHGIANSDQRIALVTPYLHLSISIADDCKKANPLCDVRPYSLLNADNIRGTNQVLIFDHTVVEFLLREILKK